MKNAIIFPYDISNMHLILHQDMLSQYRITDVVSPNAWGYSGEDAGRVLGMETGYIVQDSFENIIDRCESILFCETYIELPFDAYFEDAIEYSAQKGKELVFLCKCDAVKTGGIKKIAQKYNVSHVFVCQDGIKPYNENVANYKMVDVPVPIIAVIGINERTDKFDIQLLLRKELTKLGYNVLQIGTKLYSGIFDMIPYPGFMHSSAIDTTSKILLFNKYIHSLYAEQRPDVIILGVSGGTFPLDNKFHNNFGVDNYIVSNAVKPDYVICSLPYDNYKLEYFDFLNTHFSHKFGFEVNCFNIANRTIKWNSTDSKESVQYLTLDGKIVNQKTELYQKNGYPVYSIYSREQSSMLLETLVGNLQNNSDNELI